MVEVVEKIPRLSYETKGYYRLKVGEMADGTAITIPVVVLNGAKDGPSLCLTSAVHGDEYIGAKVVWELERHIKLNELAGKIIAVPIANPPSFWARLRVSPIDHLNLNRVWPGNPLGWMSDRIAHVVFNRVILDQKADLLIDVHTGGILCESLPHVDVTFTKVAEKSKELARAFCVEPIVEITEELTKYEEAMRFKGTLDARCGENGIPAILLELSGTNPEKDVDVALNGALNVMRYYKMIPGKAKFLEEPTFHTRRYVRPSTGGIIENKVRCGQKVKEGDVLGVVRDVFGNEVERLTAPKDGIVIVRRFFPVVQSGDEGFLLAIPK